MQKIFFFILVQILAGYHNLFSQNIVIQNNTKIVIAHRGASGIYRSTPWHLS